MTSLPLSEIFTLITSQILLMFKNKYILYGGIALILLLIAGICMTVFKVVDLRKEVTDAQAANEQLQLTNEQLQLTNEFAQIDAMYKQQENDAIKIENDTIRAKYDASKQRIEELIKQLEQEKSKNREQIKKLQAEIELLRGLCRSYLAEIDSLRKENTQLVADNRNLTGQVASLNQQNQNLSSSVQQLTEIKTLAEKLNVTGISLQALNKKGKNEKHITKARQLLTTFTIAPNHTTPAGRRNLYIRISGPDGFLGGTGSFSHDGTSLQYTAKKVIEYEGQEMPGVQIYWDVTSTLNPGDYMVEIFDDSFRLGSFRTTFKK